MTAQTSYFPAQKWLITIPPEGAARDLALAGAEALQEQAGIDLQVFDFRDFSFGYAKLLRSDDPDLVADMVAQSLLTKVMDVQAKVVVVSALCTVSAYFLQIFRKHKITTVHWFFEDYRRATYWDSVVQEYDYFFAMQKGALEAAVRQRTRFHFLPAAAEMTADECQVQPQEWDTRSWDVCFVGLPSMYRILMLNRLAAAGYKLCVAGSGWNDLTPEAEAEVHPALREAVLSQSEVSRERHMSILRQSRIGLNLSVDIPQGDRSVPQISPRAYDIAGCGTVLLTEKLGMTGVALSGLMYEEFEDENEMLAEVQKLLQFPPSLQDLQSNQLTVAEQHRVAHRMETLIDVIQAGRQL